MAELKDKIRAFHPGDYVNMKIYLLMFVGFLMITLIISSSIVFFSLRNRHKAEETIREKSSFVNSLDSSLDLLRTGDFVFPEQENLKQTQPHFQREPQDSWSEEEMARYWIDPSETGLGDISEHNRSLVEDMLGMVP
jgi:sensor histidine kinase YesM